MEIFGIGTHRRSKRTLEEQAGGRRIIIGGGSGGGAGKPYDPTADFLYYMYPLTDQTYSSPAHLPIYENDRTQISILAEYYKKESEDSNTFTRGMFCMGKTSFQTSGQHGLDGPFRDTAGRLRDLFTIEHYPNLRPWGGLDEATMGRIQALDPPRTAVRNSDMYRLMTTVNGGEVLPYDNVTKAYQTRATGRPTLLVWSYGPKVGDAYTSMYYKIYSFDSSRNVIKKEISAGTNTYRDMVILSDTSDSFGIEKLFEEAVTDFNGKIITELGKYTYDMYWAFYLTGGAPNDLGNVWPLLPNTGMQPTAEAMEALGFQPI